MTAVAMGMTVATVTAAPTRTAAAAEPTGEETPKEHMELSQPLLGNLDGYLLEIRLF
jgi:hypothetical protein